MTQRVTKTQDEPKSPLDCVRSSITSQETAKYLISNLSRLFSKAMILLTFDFEQRLGGCIAYFVFGNTQKSATVHFLNSDDYRHYGEDYDEDDDDEDYGRNDVDFFLATHLAQLRFTSQR